MSLNINNIKFIILSYSIIIISFYSTVITSTYAFFDDYGTIENAIDNIPAPWIFDIYSGRPIFALFRVIDGSITGGIDDLWMQRSFSVASLVLLAIFLNRFITNKKLFSRDEFNFTFPLMITLLPSFQVYASWATCYPFTLAVLFSGLAYSFLTSDAIKRPWARWIFSFLFISSSFAIYQPAGMAFMAFALIDQSLNPNSFDFRKLIKSICMMCLGMISSLAMVKVVPLIAFGKTMQRSSMTLDPAGKIYWFFNEALPNSLTNYSISPNESFLIIGMALFFIGMAFIFKTKDGLTKIIFTITFIIASYFPNMYVSENWAAQRSMIALSMGVVGVMLFGIMKLFEIFLKKSDSTIPAILSVLLITSAGVTASGNINNYMVINQISERQSLAAEIASKVDKSFDGNVMVDISHRNWGAFSSVVRYDEFGENSIYAPWTVRGALLSIAKSKGYIFSVPEHPVISDDNKCQDNCILINPGDAMLRSTVRY